MITKEVNEWLRKVKNNQYSYEDAMYEFQNFSRYLTIDEIKQLKKAWQKR